MPRVRGGVPVVGAVRPPDRRTRTPRWSTHPAPTHAVRRSSRRLAEWFALPIVLPAPRGAARAHLGAARRATAAARAPAVRPAPALARVVARAARSPTTAPPDAYLFTGCVMDAWQRDIHRAAVRGDARRRRASVGLPGARWRLLRRAARPRRARSARRGRWRSASIASMPGDAPVVVDSAGCGAAMKDYGRLLGTPAAHAFAARVVDFSEWVGGADPPPRARHRRRRWWCRIRATSATCRRPRARCAPCSRPPTGWTRPTTTGCAAAPAARTPCANPSSRLRIRERKVAGAARRAP